MWFIASEGFSILENVASMGIPVPKILLKVLEVMRDKGDYTEANADTITEDTEEIREAEQEPIKPPDDPDDE